MKKLLGIALGTMAFIGLVFRIGLSDFEIGKYDNLQEAIETGIPNRVNNIIRINKYDGMTIVMYTTNPDQEAFPFADYEALAVAFFVGNREDGWENIGHHGWGHYENNNMTVYTEAVREHDEEGNVLHELYVVFGEVNNAEIVTVETKTKDEKTFEEVELIKNNGSRYYLQIGRETIVRGLSREGKVIDKQGG